MHLFEELVKNVCGSNGISILKLLEGKENVSEFILAENLDMNINELRTLLYKLTEHNLITSIRKKDKQKGWYVYYWTFNFRHARDLLIRFKEEKLKDLNNKINNKEVPKYVCPNGCISIDLENAMEIEFKCPECNSLLKLKEVKYNEEILKKKISEIEEELGKIRQTVIVEIVPKEKKPARRKEVKKKAVKKKIKKKPSKKKIKKKAVKKKIKKKSARKQKPINKKIKKNTFKKPKKKSGFLRKIKRKIRF
jgi:transcription factor E